MDASLIQMYRLVLQDCVLLYDVFNLTTNSIRGLPSVREFADAVAAVIHNEAQLKRMSGSGQADGGEGLDPSSMLTTNNREFSDQRKSINLIWEYVHSVLLPFFVEELSQFPFWAAKVCLLTDDALLDGVKDLPISSFFLPESLASRFFAHIAAKYAQHGLLSLFEGSLSYISVGASFPSARRLASTLL